MSRRIVKVLVAATATGAGASSEILGMSNVRTSQAVLTGTGTLACTVKLQGSVDNVNWTDINTFTLSDTAPVAGNTSTDGWPFVRGDVTAISGTSASVSITLAA